MTISEQAIAVPDAQVDGLGVAQRWVLIVCAVLLAGMLVCPPWSVQWHLGPGSPVLEVSAGYALLMNPPKPADMGPSVAERVKGVRIDLVRLVSQAAAVGVLGAVAFVLARNWDRRAERS